MRTEGKAPSPNDQPVEDLIKDWRKNGDKVTEEYDNAGNRSIIRRESSTKTSRDWLQIFIQLLTALALPITLFLGAQWFASQQNQASQQIATVHDHFQESEPTDGPFVP